MIASSASDFCRHQYPAALRPNERSAFSITRAALTKLRARQEIVCIAPQNLVEFWVVATRPRGAENGLGFPHARAASEITMLQGLFHVLPYKPEVLETWKHIVTLHGVTGKQAHDAHLVAMMQVHSVASILTFNTGHFTRFPGITVLDPAQV